MNTLGLIGGISWISSADYYRLLNEGINEKLGGLNFSKCILHSFNYQDIKDKTDAGDWDAIFRMLEKAALDLQRSGADAILLCANTMHYIADRLQEVLDIPIIHIAEATAAEIKRTGLQKVALLGTKFTMEADFFTDVLKKNGIEALLPENVDREFIHHTIYEELGRGTFVPETKLRYISIIDKLVESGAEGVILGCTEIPLLIKPEDVSVPVFDTLALHVKAAIDFSLA